MPEGEPDVSRISDHVAVLSWLALGVAVGGLLVLAYGYILLDQRKLDLYDALDAWLMRHVPRGWQWSKARVSSTRHLHVGLGAAALVAAGVAFLMAELIESWVDQRGLFVVDQIVYRALVQSSNPRIESALGVVTHLGSFEVGPGYSGPL